MIRSLENLMYQMSDFFLAPVLVLLAVLFAYSLFVLGVFFATAWQRSRNAEKIQCLPRLNKEDCAHVAGYPLAQAWLSNRTISQDELDVAALKELEGVRMVSRIAPMLGLIATMVPMGPALKSLANGNVQGISDNLIVAFSAVIFGLVIATITFWIATIKKRWLAMELVHLNTLNQRHETPAGEDIREAA
ncbi:MotA/TolQ/ExbB proton channel family protein [Teredinibacter purpureus]|uniref:MotA/TolQ/ExbB proton channel family protein n=1 Tax=Teredinibacter purpureus TaxID=2731756 RepID=UPI0005F862A8|nr:MotA/TolQ/ExbB proton channel family protein [Teredinibacter purpureus]